MTLFETISFNLNNENYHRKIYNILINKDITKKQKVQFSFYCAKDLDKCYDTKKFKEIYNSRQKCLDLIGKWLINENSVSQKQLDEAAYSAYSAYSAANAAYPASNVAYSAAYSAANAAFEEKKEEIQIHYFHYLLQLLEMDYKIFRLVS